MKQLLLLLLVPLSGILHAQTGNVGIGTSSPNQKLHVESLDTTGYAGAIKLSTPNMDSSSQAVLMFGKNTGTRNQAEIRYHFDGNSSINNQYQFGFSNIQPFVFFNGNTRVGIGEENPDAKLHVNGNVKVSDGTQGAGKVLTSDADGLATWAESTTDTLNIIADADKNTNITIDNSDIINISQNGVQYFKLDNGKFQFVNTGGNTYIGENSGQNADLALGTGNTALGHLALQSNMGNARDNVAVGSQAMQVSTTGRENVAIGRQALQNGTPGDGNVAIGMRALNANSGQKNVAIGRDVMRFNTNGSFNTSIGQESGNQNQGSLNVFMGYQAGFNETGDEKLYIDNSNTNTPLIYGDFASNAVTINGTANITEDIIVNNVVIGRRGTTTNMVVGEGALENLSTGQYNTGVGQFSMQNNDEGTENTGLGYNSLTLNTSGGQNTGIGSGALYRNQTSSSNTAVGYTALGESTGGGNTAIGASAMVDLLTGFDNVAVGAGVMGGLGAGSQNTAIGYNSGSLAIGNGNVFIGNRAGFNETGNEKLYLDNTDTTTPLIGGDFASNAVTINGTIHITQTAKLTPLATAPGCGAGDAGLMYFDDTSKKLRVCDGTIWQDTY